jgi:transposase
MAKKKQFLSDAMWEEMEQLLPKWKPGRKGGRPRVESRRVLEGILWILWTGAPWSALPGEYPSASTCWRRLKQWEEDGTWLRIWRAFMAELDEQGQLAWSESFMDATFVPAKKGARRWVKPRGARARSLWWWQTARVFLWETDFTLHPRPKSRSRQKRSKK